MDRELFRQAYRRLAAGIECRPAGPVVSGAGGNCVAFQFEIREDRIRTVEYRCPCCVTLIALCERLSDLSWGERLAAVA